MKKPKLEDNLRDEQAPITFIHEYTRDFSIIIEEAWTAGIMACYNKIFCIPFTYLEPAVYYIKNGIIEVWDNDIAFKIIQQKILEANQKNNLFFEKWFARDLKQKKKIEPILQKGIINTLEELPEFIKIVYETIHIWFPLYYTAYSKKTPSSIREKAIKWRDADLFWDRASNVLCNTLIKLYPDRKKFVAHILTSEIKNPPSYKSLEQRAKNFVLIPGRIQKIQTLKKFAANHPEFYFSYPSLKIKNNEISGKTAYRGKVSGVARIVYLKKEINKVQPGEILVSPMTTPDFIPAMKKAAAIVTDEGGVTCHAAIIAREMKKPCVVGTQVATKVLKDGMIVEVDADNGIIKIIR